MNNAKRFINDHPGWKILTDTDDNYIDLSYRFYSDNAPSSDDYPGLHVEIILTVNLEINCLSCATFMRDEESDEESDFLMSVEILEEITPFIDEHLLIFKTYFPDNFKVNTYTSFFRESYLDFAIKNISTVNSLGDTELIKLAKNIPNFNKIAIANAIMQMVDAGADIQQCNYDGESAFGILQVQKANIDGKLLAYIEKIELESIVEQDEFYHPGL